MNNIPDIQLKAHPKTGELIPEIWKDIENYEGLYMISNYGRVVSLSRYKTIGNNKFLSENKILKDCVGKHGYCNLFLYKNGKLSQFRKHRVVAQVFIPNPENKPHINHINEIKTDNFYLNLEWCTRKENMNCGTVRERISKNHNPSGKNKKKVYQYDLEGNLTKEWDSLTECTKQGYNITCISECCNGKQKTHKGFRWSFKKLN